MIATVVEPPEPVVSLDRAQRHLTVEHSDDDELITDLIAVATGHLDGPDGWLGRAIGVQVIEVTMPTVCWRRDRDLPFPPLQEVVSETLSSDGHTVTIRYRAGYVVVPAPIRHAILLMVGDLYANRESNVVGVSQTSVAMPTTVENLLAPFRVWRA